MTKRKKYIWGIVVACIAAGLVIFSIAKSAYTGVDSDAGRIMQVITADMKHERTISWKTAAMGSPGSLEVRAKQAKDSTVVKAEVAELPVYNGGKPYTLYTAHAKNLLPGTEYEYRVTTGKRQSPWQEFRTEPETTAFKTLIFGDSQSVDYKEWANTAQSAWKRVPDAAFFVNMGDLVDNGQDDYQWNAWFDGAAKLSMAIPIAPVMGNHEAYNLDWKMALPTYYLTLFAIPGNGPSGLERYAYSYDYGDVHFIVLNTQSEELRSWYPDLLKQQQKWLQKDLAQTQKKWKVVLMHRGIWKHPFNGPLDENGSTFAPLFDTYHVDLVFTGHVHSYARTAALKNGRRDPAGTVYITTGRSGEKTWDKSPQKPMDEVYYNPLDMPNYLVLEASQAALKVAAFKQNDELIDQTEIKK